MNSKSNKKTDCAKQSVYIIGCNSVQITFASSGLSGVIAIESGYGKAGTFVR